MGELIEALSALRPVSLLDAVLPVDYHGQPQAWDVARLLDQRVW